MYLKYMFLPHRIKLTLTSALLALSSGCGSSGEEAGTLGPPVDSADNEDALTPLGRPRCRAPEGMSGSPETIDEAVILLNALPKPTSVACFLESLDRPLAVVATNSVFSAQPALSTRSPRVFVRSKQLLLSVVVDGESRDLIEFGYLFDNDSKSLKGELALPIDAPVAPSSPYDRVALANSTVCGGCHYDEQALNLPNGKGYASVAFRPRADSLVRLESLLHETEICDVTREPQRCEMLSALFRGGAVQADELPQSMVTFF
jgi:hypothetical protein